MFDRALYTPPSKLIISSIKLQIEPVIVLKQLIYEDDKLFVYYITLNFDLSPKIRETGKL